MTIDERLAALTQTVELIAALQRETETRLVQMMDAINRLANIVDAHEVRLDDHQ